MKTMKRMKTLLKEQTGFTLVELMVVVAIIGVLSAVAVPNFKKYQAKAKTSEAKVQLAAAYTAMHSFYADFGMFANCLAYMGYNPSAETNNRYYAIGFDAPTTIDDDAYQTATNSGIETTECPKAMGENMVTAASEASDLPTIFGAGKGAGGLIVDTAAIFATATGHGDWVIGNQAGGNHTFVVGASGSISGENIAGSADASESSSFSINENKFVKIHKNGY